ncbi:hypothetical protein [Puia dinghuensis]|uniref:Uncharacterized protein n=1 Tax=Puia dinghuensis TaxID=1792502 RepID=A0A8J2XS93_9BACT|nr:hypothetical protein [Puia dinghuensis]GGA93095.1 hypothetical protein GCM10011511_15630 [Puia dinghuensis]
MVSTSLFDVGDEVILLIEAASSIYGIGNGNGMPEVILEKSKNVAFERLAIGLEGGVRNGREFRIFENMDSTIYERRWTQHDVLYREVLGQFEREGQQVPFPAAKEVLDHLVERLDDVYQGMVDLAGWPNLYSLSILYRALLDHYVLILYITDKTGRDGSDATAEAYKKHLFISEFLMEHLKEMKMEDLLNRVENDSEFLDYLVKKFPIMEGFDKGNQKELSAGAGQFREAHMVEYLTKSFEDRGLVELARTMAWMLPEYGRTFPFVHGGAYAGVQWRNMREQGKVDAEMGNKLWLGLTMVGVCKEHCLMLCGVDESFPELLGEFQKLRNVETGP